jgi:hypothetical protein
LDLKTRWLLICWCVFVLPAFANPYASGVEESGLQELEQVFDDARVARALDGAGVDLGEDSKRSAAVLVSAGLIGMADLDEPGPVSGRIQSLRHTLGRNQGALMGRIGDAMLQVNLAKALDHSELLAADEFLAVLGEELDRGVITGYDLRQRSVYDGFPPGRTFIYSQSSQAHMRQLVALMSSEGINAWVYVVPKVSAFLYRDDWGPASDNVVTLDGGARVVRGRELAALFHFDTREDRLRFHELITLFAKKDEKDEPGLIVNAWWQPFYYSDEPVVGFMEISLVVMSSARFEATLTVLPPKTASVVAALKDKPWPTRVDTVWVNPPFYRFLQGGYK